MCGIVGVVAHTPVNQLLYDGLLLLQHRGQDAAGIVTSEGPIFHMYKGPGYVRDVFRTRNMRELLGHSGIAHCRYPTAGSAFSALESQPFYVNSPFGLSLAHNGNLTNSEALKRELFQLDFRHVNTNSDSEVLLNVLALELERAAQHHRLDPDAIFKAVAGVHRRCRGAYAVVAMIAGYGMLAFRDPYGIRPLIIGGNEAMGGREYLVASEVGGAGAARLSVLRDVAPGEAIYVDQTGRVPRARLPPRTHSLNPCIFEYVYPRASDSVHGRRARCTSRASTWAASSRARSAAIPAAQDVDVVIPDPDSSRPYALELANQLGKVYREASSRTRYIGRTFIMPGHGDAQEERAPEARTRSAWSSRTRSCCWSTTPSCAAPRRARSSRWRATPARARCTSPRRAHPCVSQRVRHRHAEPERARRDRPHRRRRSPTRSAPIF
jgi:amidophosphoribosyltransferase